MVRIPFNFDPRPYQLPFLSAMDSGKKRAVLVWHRRAGKDKCIWNYTIREAMRRVGSYYYFFPTYAQARKTIWDGKDKGGFAFLDHIPPAIRKGEPNNTEMKVFLNNGSLIQLVGSDNIDSIMGTNPVGVVFSEYSLSDPRGWDFVRPILRENGGWAVFPYTPRGKNHGYTLYEMARRAASEPSSEWFCDRLTIEDTYGRGGTVSKTDVDEDRKSGMRENLIEQEYYCSFEAAVENAVWGDEVYAVRREKRICRVPWESRVPVETYWDIGWDDSTAVWFVQQVRNEIRLIDYYEARLSSLEHYVKVLKDKPYVYGRHVLPHDAGYKDMKYGKSTQEVAAELGLFVEIGQKLNKEDQIQSARSVFNRCWFDEDKCGKGFDALASYHFGFDEAKRVLSRSPVHDWASHASDAFQLMAQQLRPLTKSTPIKYPAMGIV